MGTLACILGLLLCGGVGEEEWREPAVATASLPDTVVRVPMDHSSRRILLPVRIDGRGPFLFQLDTTSRCALVVDAELAASLAEASGEAAGASGRDAPAGDAVPGGLRIGRLELGDAGFLDVAAEVRALGGTVSPGVRGVLGLPLFQNLLLTIDYVGSELVLSHGALPRDAVDVFPLLGPGDTPHVPLQVGGHVWTACIDTGDPENVTFPAGAERDVRTQRRPVVLGGRAGGAEPTVRGARLAEPLLVAGRGYQQLPVLFAEDATEPRLGYGLLAHYVLTFDQRQKLVRFGLTQPQDVLAREHAAPASGGGPAGVGAWTATHHAVSGLAR
jgi:hypothetical protein